MSWEGFKGQREKKGAGGSDVVLFQLTTLKIKEMCRSQGVTSDSS